MAGNNNGFAQALNDLRTLGNANQNVSKRNLEKAAEYFISKLEQRIGKSNMNKKHLRDSLVIVIKDDHVSVQFEKDKFYWYMVEHGHKKSNGKGRVKGQHFVRNTADEEQEKLLNIMMNRLSE
ncbi:HK97-gp10 family putative phage morphogenesis protein [Niallia taxi]|uniref:HK97-gp10 family putative phage morphogenesis protein n=1 Tax=Niallia taxi TaxID=2499688 RepID=UPI002550901A|nr:HK97-gp10 family putative phage morphogenesis protein [Niallia taxi]MDK8641331.1 HK97 gp10 family phage protein [Niallia taxi]